MRFLVVEDELKMLRALRRGLEQEGHAVEVATRARSMFLMSFISFHAVVASMDKVASGAGRVMKGP